VTKPTDEQLKSAKVVILSTGTNDAEGWDRPFALPAEEEKRVEHVLALNSRTIVIVNSGGGIKMTDWNDRAAALVYAWYPGQIGNRAVAEVLSGQTNPSGRLPMTIERRFEDSPGYGYMPAGEKFYTGWGPDGDMKYPVYNIEYKEGIFVGYRWYESKKIQPLYAFGSGLSYTTFALSNARVSAPKISSDASVDVSCEVLNSGKVSGTETVQVYVHPVNAPVARPEKELKGFAKAKLDAGARSSVSVTLAPQAFAYWDVETHGWKVAPGEYEILIGTASDKISARTKVTIE